MITVTRTLRWIVVVGSLSCALQACSRRSGADDERPALSERQRDSIIAKSKLPGANLVGKAIIAADTAAARSARADSMAR